MRPICPGPPFCGGGPSCPQHGDATVQIVTDPPTPGKCRAAMWWNQDGTVRSRCGRTDCDHPPGTDAGGPVPVADMINEPPHYRSICGVTIKSGRRILAGDLEALDVIEAFDLGPHLSNVIKYCLRAGRKGPDVEDLKKARMYLDRKIARAERGE